MVTVIFYKRSSLQVYLTFFLGLISVIPEQDGRR